MHKNPPPSRFSAQAGASVMRSPMSTAQVVRYLAALDCDQDRPVARFGPVERSRAAPQNARVLEDVAVRLAVHSAGNVADAARDAVRSDRAAVRASRSDRTHAVEHHAGPLHGAHVTIGQGHSHINDREA